MVRKLFFVLFIIFSISFTTATESCPYGITHDPAPGLCNLYEDENKDWFCDLWEDEEILLFTPSWIEENKHQEEKKEEDHICDSVISSQSIKQVAEFYKIDVKVLQETLEKYLNTKLLTSTTIWELNENFWFKPYLANDIAASIKEWKNLSINNIDNISKKTISGKEMKQMTIWQIAEFYWKNQNDFAMEMSNLINIRVTPETQFTILHDTYWLESKMIKDLINNKIKNQVQVKIETQIQEEHENHNGIKMYLQAVEFGQFLFFVIILLIIYLIHQKYPLTKLIEIVSYYILPIIALWLTINVWMIEQTWQDVFGFGREIWYLCLWLLFIILIAKPITVLTKPKKKTKKSLFSVHQRLSFIILQRRPLWILVFWLWFFHFLVYMLFRLNIWVSVFNFIWEYFIITGLIWLVALLIWFITSNNKSIFYFKKYRKPIQMTAYIALLFSVIHIILIKTDTAFVLVPATIIYVILKILELRK